MTKIVLEYIRKNREMFLNIVNSLSVEQLNKIPSGFNNNIIWNFGHSIVSTQGLCYLRSGVKPDLQIPFLKKYGKDSKPESFITKEEIDELKEQAISTINNIEKDIAAGLFEKVAMYATATYKLEMHSIEEILTCVLAHEAMHFGYALAQRKLVI